MRALIVDDSRFVRSLLRALLEEKGFACTEAGDGSAALATLRGGGHYDIAFIDWNMPVMNGLELVQHLRKDGFTAKVMMVTTESETSFILRALGAGVDEYLMKPFDEVALSEKLALLGFEAA